MGPTPEQSVLDGLYPVEIPTLEQLLKNCGLWEVPTLELLMKDSLLWEKPAAGTWGECEEEGAVELKCHELTVTLTAFPSVLLSGEDIDELGEKLSV